MTYRLTPPGAALSDLAAVSPPIQGTDILAVRRSGVDYRATAAQLLAYMQANLTFAGIPPTITTLATSSIGTTTVALTWTEGGGAATSRSVQTRTPSGSGSYSSATTTGSSPGAITVTGLTSSTAYDIQVTVTNASGSNTATLTNITTSSSLAAPTIASLAHGTVTTTTIPLTWTEGGGTVASRTVQIRTPSGSGSYSSATTTGLGSGSATITGLTANTAYDVQVMVTNTTGSNTATMTNTSTAALPTITVNTPSSGTASGALSLSGTYTGTEPTGLNYRFDGTGSYVAASPFTSDHSGGYTATGVYPATGSHTVQVQEANATTVTATSGSFTVGGASNPSTIMSAPYGWWDSVNSTYADVGLTTPANVGDTVNGLKNLLTNGTKSLVAEVPERAMKKVTGAASNGLPAITGLTDSYNQYAWCASTGSWPSSLTGDMTILAVYKTTGGGNAGVFDAVQFRLDLADGFGPNFSYSGVGIDEPGANGGVDANPDAGSGGGGPLLCVVMRVNASAKTMTIKVNNRQQASGSFTTNISAPPYILFHGEFNTMQLYEVAISTAYETDSVRDGLISYAAARWGT